LKSERVLKAKVDAEAEAKTVKKDAVKAFVQEDKNVTKEVKDGAKNETKDSANASTNATANETKPVTEEPKEVKNVEKGDAPKYTYHTSGGTATSYEFKDVKSVPVEYGNKGPVQEKPETKPEEKVEDKNSTSDSKNSTKVGNATTEAKNTTVDVKAAVEAKKEEKTKAFVQEDKNSTNATAVDSNTTEIDIKQKPTKPKFDAYKTEIK